MKHTYSIFGKFLTPPTQPNTGKIQALANPPNLLKIFLKINLIQTADIAL